MAPLAVLEGHSDRVICVAIGEVHGLMQSLEGQMQGMNQNFEGFEGKMAEMQDEMHSILVTGESGAGLVKVTMNGIEKEFELPAALQRLYTLQQLSNARLELPSLVTTSPNYDGSSNPAKFRAEGVCAAALAARSAAEEPYG
mgnify:CR=1 FL=1